MPNQLTSFLSRILSLLFLYPLFCSNAVAQHAPANALGGSYSRHDPHLNASRHNEEFFTFLSRPDIEFAPRWDIQVYENSSVSPGFWLISPYASFVGDVSGPTWTAPFIYNGDGELVWYGGYTTSSWTASDFRVSDVMGKPMLTLVHHEEGKAFLIDETYNIHRKVDLTDVEHEKVNGHEFALVDEGTRAIHFINRDEYATEDESARIGFDGKCFVRYDGFRELDTQSWETVFEWDERDHISVTFSVKEDSQDLRHTLTFVYSDFQLEETYGAPDETPEEICGRGKAFDYTHLNAMHKFPDGDFLVSSRRTFTLYKVSHKTGAIIWRLGGKRSDFQLDTAWTGQHGARLHSQNETHVILSFLDNAKFTHSMPPTHETSRALFLVLHVTERPMRAETLLSIDQPLGAYNMARGNVQLLPNGNVWACWVTNCLVSEHNNDGNMVMKAQLKPDFTTYRGYKFEWTGRPSLPPDVHAAAVVQRSKVGVVVHVSWNGATEVKRWRAWRSDSNGRLLQRLEGCHSDWMGFETKMNSDEFARYLVVEALDFQGNPLGRSDVVAVSVPQELSDMADAAHEQWEKEHVADTSSLSTMKDELYEMVQDRTVQIVSIAILATSLLATVVTIIVLRRRRGKQTTQTTNWWNSKEKIYEAVPIDEN